MELLKIISNVESLQIEKGKEWHGEDVQIQVVGQLLFWLTVSIDTSYYQEGCNIGWSITPKMLIELPKWDTFERTHCFTKFEQLGWTKILYRSTRSHSISWGCFTQGVKRSDRFALGLWLVWPVFSDNYWLFF